MSKPRRPKRAVDGILLLDKPPGITSNAALMEVRRLFQADKAGHTGSLDPMATGMLPICLGNATKLSGQLLASDKAYRATICLGARTDSGDADGTVVESASVPAHDAAQVIAILDASCGPQTQIPPMVSALKHEGQRLYALAREGVEIARAPRDIVIHQLKLVDWQPMQWVIDVQCSKGTYIRVLAEDLAQKLGTLAHLIALRRQWVTPFRGTQYALSQLQAIASDGGHVALDACLLPLSSALVQWPKVVVTGPQAAQLRAGQPIAVQDSAASEVGAAQREVAVLDGEGVAISLAVWRDDGLLWPKRWLSRDEKP